MIVTILQHFNDFLTLLVKLKFLCFPSDFKVQ